MCLGNNFLKLVQVKNIMLQKARIFHEHISVLYVMQILIILRCWKVFYLEIDYFSVSA